MLMKQPMFKMPLTVVIAPKEGAAHAQIIAAFPQYEDSEDQRMTTMWGLRQRNAKYLGIMGVRSAPSSNQTA
jgi:hypothetical protein